MTEKYKIYLPEDIKTRLINDAELFEFTKKDESVNLNAFLKTLIVNFFEQYTRDSEKLLNNIIKDLTDITAISDRNARKLADKGWCVLLSPACASFDMFKDYEERGRVFKQIVQELK